MVFDFVHCLNPHVIQNAHWLGISELIYVKQFSSPQEPKQCIQPFMNSGLSLKICHLVQFSSSKGFEKISSMCDFSALRVSSLPSFQLALHSPKIQFLVLDFSQKMELDVQLARLLVDKEKIFIIPISLFLTAKPHILPVICAKFQQYWKLLKNVKAPVIFSSFALTEWDTRSKESVQSFAEFLHVPSSEFKKFQSRAFAIISSSNSLSGFTIISKR